ncbi:unnamed protein product [Paramecium pentaurelia]|uniref:non-specific serine/threonine protein kinase n=2 Tax=Paramecium TaxID=5884 RepID=A0A8S1U1B2_9CILI|nr:unnamed protein product [Paramecium pentaurelia]
MDTKVSDSKSPSKSIKPNIQDYISIGSLGRGAYGEVILAQKKTDNQQVAIKVIDKKFLTREQKQYQVYIEREMLLYLKHPGVVQLYSTFQKPEKLYFVMEYLEGGDFADFLKLHKDLSFQTLQFYLAQIVVILEYIHSKGVAHRDLKPENLMLSKNGHLKLIDFGTSMVVHENKVPVEFLQKYKQIKSSFQIQEGSFINRASFVGTAEYVSPEMLEEEPCEYAVDLWALGIICYKMFTGVTPFIDSTQYLVFQNVKNAQVKIPENVPKVAANLIQKILVRNPQERLGSQSMADLKSHPFFKGIEWDKLFQMQAPQPKVVSVKSVEKSIDPDLQLGGKRKSKLKFYGVVQFKIGWFIYRPLDLVLIEGKEYMKLALFDPETEKCQLKIRLVEGVQVYSPSKGYMEIKDQNKKYSIKEVEHPIDKWLEVIEKCRKNLIKKKQKKQEKKQ